MLNTYGYDITEVTKYLSDEMADRFVKATVEKDEAFMQACYDVLMQMKSVSSSGKIDISDSAVLDAYNLILGNEVAPIR